MYRSPSSAATKSSPRPKAQPEMNSSLLRFSSAPSSLLGEICENFQSVRPETETEPFFPCFVAEQNGAFSSMSSQLIYEAEQEEPVAENSYRAVSFVPGGGSLIRQSSSPAEFLSHLNGDSGYGMMRRMPNSNRNSTVGDFKGQISFSSRQNSLSQISEMASEGISDAGESPEEYTVSSWEGSLLSDNFSARESKRDGDVLGLNQTEFQNGGGLAHQFSLPKSGSEMAAIEKFLHFQDSVPCKIRAKRGCATHPRSIAERVRRTRISERMRKLQELVPNMDKQTNTADMLDLAVDYIKHLQKQVKSISDVRATCTCLVSKQKPCQNQGS